MSVQIESSERWGAHLELDDVTITAPLTADIVGRVVALVHRFGFAIVDSAAHTASGCSVAERSRHLLEFGNALGTPVVQSPRNELVEDVKDYSDVDERDDRGYRSRGELTPHSDPPTLIVLDCVTPARLGGETSLVSVDSIVRRMLAQDRTLVDELLAPLPDWRVAGQHGIAVAGPADRPRPVLAYHGGRLSCVLYRPYVELGASTAGQPLTSAQTAALDLFERYSMSDDLTLRFRLQPRQTLVLHNRSVLHARTDYVDWPDPDRRRHLLRMWIDSPDRFPVHPGHELGDFFAPMT
ncbi:MAG: TauD/TfdA family dioxygenase [Ilumatobacter sp.]|nr:TauD/TfdA family dioxygenase [Ilumatobacter sp.]